LKIETIVFLVKLVTHRRTKHSALVEVFDYLSSYSKVDPGAWTGAAGLSPAGLKMLLMTGSGFKFSSRCGLALMFLRPRNDERWTVNFVYFCAATSVSPHLRTVW